MAKITIIRGGSARTPGIAARCSATHPLNQKITCTRKAAHAGQHTWSHALRDLQEKAEKPQGTKRKNVSVATKLDCLQMIEDPVYRKKLLIDLRARKLRPAVECMLWYYAKGKPKEMIEHSGVLTLQQELAALSPEELRQRALDVAAMLQAGAPVVH